MATRRPALHGHLIASLVRDAMVASAKGWRSIWPWGLAPGSPGAFAFAAACVAAATAVHIAFGLVRPETVIFAPYYAATLVAVLLGGGAAGLLAMVLGGIVASWLFAPPPWSGALITPENLENWALYGSSSVVILRAAVSYRGLLQRLREEQRKRQLLNEELAHRLGNTFASVQAIVNQSLAGEKELRERINARLAALAATNALLVKSDWQTASLMGILIGEFTPYDPSRIRVRGEDVQCPSCVAAMVALVIHELTTNAAKHGALAKPDGCIDLSWQIVERRLTMHWVESGCTNLAPPTRRGFGTRLLQSAVRGFQGHIETSFDPTGLRCKIFLPLPEPGL
jgi:two-component sensor histidine kinase